MKDCNGTVRGYSRNVVVPEGKYDSGHVLTVIEAIKSLTLRLLISYIYIYIYDISSLRVKDYVHHKNMVLHVYGLVYNMKHNLINTFHFKYDIFQHASSFI
jgi:hypothetical protein